MATEAGTVEVVMPAMGDSVAEGTVLEWRKQEGDPVAADETIVEISTDKVDAEVPAPVAGRLAKILAAEGETIAVGAALADWAAFRMDATLEATIPSFALFVFTAALGTSRYRPLSIAVELSALLGFLLVAVARLALPVTHFS